MFFGSDWSATFLQALSAWECPVAVVQNEQGTDDGDRTEIWWNTENPPISVLRRSTTVSGDRGGVPAWLRY